MVKNGGWGDLSEGMDSWIEISNDKTRMPKSKHPWVALQSICEVNCNLLTDGHKDATPKEKYPFGWDGQES